MNRDIRCFLAGAAAACLFLNCNVLETASPSAGDSDAPVLAKLAAPPAGTSCLVPASGIVGWWPGDGNALDYSGLGHHGMLRGAAMFAAGYADQGFLHGGTGDYAEIASTSSLNPASGITLEAWVRLEAYTYYPGIISKGDVGTGVESYSLFINELGQPGFILNYEGSMGGRTMIIVQDIVPLNEWTHIAGTYDGLTMKLYIDGLQRGIVDYFYGIVATPYPVMIGLMEKEGDASMLPSMSGMIDEPTIYDRALAYGEIEAIYNAGTFGKCRPPAPDPTPDPVPDPAPEPEPAVVPATVEEAEAVILQAELQFQAAQEEILSARDEQLSEVGAALQAAKDAGAAKDVIRALNDELQSIQKTAIQEVNDARAVMHEIEKEMKNLIKTLP